MAYRFWTEEEIDYLEKKWGEVETLKICKKLNRSYQAVRDKAKRLKLGPAAHASEMINANSLAQMMNVDRKQIEILKTKGLKHTKRRLGASNRRNVFIEVTDFWKFAKKNKKIIKFYKFNFGDVPKEPSWVQEVRLQQLIELYKMPKKCKNWTNEEDKALIRMCKRGLQVEEIAKALGRSEVGVISRKSVLSVNPRERWTKEEISILKRMTLEGFTDKDIANKLGKKLKGVIWKRNRLNIKKRGGCIHYEQSNFNR